jgi:hypothetical protein
MEFGRRVLLCLTTGDVLIDTKITLRVWCRVNWCFAVKPDFLFGVDIGTKLAKLFLTKSLAVDDSEHWIIDLDLALREGICNLVIVPSNWIVKAPTFSLVHFLVRL